jgi:hypothetical protein
MNQLGALAHCWPVLLLLRLHRQGRSGGKRQAKQEASSAAHRRTVRNLAS